MIGRKYVAHAHFITAVPVPTVGIPRLRASDSRKSSLAEAFDLDRHTFMLFSFAIAGRFLDGNTRLRRD